jgi:aminopeptidase N
MFRKGMDLYFERHDGEATTVEAFVACFADACGRDLSGFFGWYDQAGTPQVSLTAAYDAGAKTLDLTLAQTTAPTPGQPDKRPLPIPLRLGLQDADGRALTFTAPGAQTGADSALIVLQDSRMSVRLEGVQSAPVVSALRDFSAPVKLTTTAPEADAYVLLAADPDLFNRWEAGQVLACALMLARAAGRPDDAGEKRFAAALARALTDQSSEAAFKALLLSLPSEQELSLASSPADPAAIHAARDELRARLAVGLNDRLQALHADLGQAGDFSPDAVSAGRRALGNAALDLLAATPTDSIADLASRHYDQAANMTDAMGGLNALMLLGGKPFDDALAHFYDRWQGEPLVIDKWFAIQARSPAPDVLDRVQRLMRHPAFDARNPNRLRALLQTFASANPARFHDPSGAGYRFLADQTLATDAFNPSVAARMIEPLGSWRRYRPGLADLMLEQLKRIAQTPGLSKNVHELASRAQEDR